MEARLERYRADNESERVSLMSIDELKQGIHYWLRSFYKFPVETRFELWTEFESVTLIPSDDDNEREIEKAYIEIKELLGIGLNPPMTQIKLYKEDHRRGKSLENQKINIFKQVDFKDRGPNCDN